MRRAALVTFVLFVIGVAAGVAAADNYENINWTWCGGDCSEGHDDKECICSFNKTCPEGYPGCWNWCQEINCCDWTGAYCDLGYVIGDYDGDGYGESCWYQDPPYTEWCGVFQDGNWRYCEAQCGTSGCYATYMVDHYEWVNDTSSLPECTRENETCGFWNSWRCHNCRGDSALADQSPWDDDGDTYICEQ
ncbi:MAG TPA: hypothetical protein VIG06_10440 [Kofleriaceae bacterium]